MISPRARSVLMLLVALLAAGTFRATGAQPAPPSSETAGTVDAAVISGQIEAFARDLERLRRFMGAPKAGELDIGIRSAIPRDLYFQTLTLWQQTDRLLFEIMRVHANPPPAPAGAIDLRDALATLQDANQILQQVMRELRIVPTAEPPPTPMPEGKATLADSFIATLDLTRQLDLLVERHIAPRDVYREVTLAVAYAARLLARYAEATRLPAEPSFEPGQQPGDVYRRLIGCLQSIARIFATLGLPVLQIDTSQTDVANLRPGDVFLVASMIVSQLDFLYQRLDSAKARPQATYPGFKFPSHTYQRAGILQAQLTQIERFLATDRAASGESHEPAAPER